MVKTDSNVKNMLVLAHVEFFEEKRENILCSRMTNIPKRIKKRSIPQRLETDLGWSVEATTVIKQLWLTEGLRAQPSNYPQKLWNQKDTHLKKYIKNPFI